MQTFISHNKEDKNIARQIGIFLTLECESVWFDEWEIAPGDSITLKMNQGLINCSHFILLWSKSASLSNWVRRELFAIISKMIKNGSPKIIPIVLDDTPLPSILEDISYIRFSDDIEEAREKIVSAITGHSPSQNYIKAVVKEYNQVIIDNESNEPFRIKACPNCGSVNIIKSEIIDERHDEVYYVAKCKDCSWSDWT